MVSEFFLIQPILVIDPFSFCIACWHQVANVLFREHPGEQYFHKVLLYRTKKSGGALVGLIFQGAVSSVLYHPFNLISSFSSSLFHLMTKMTRWRILSCLLYDAKKTAAPVHFTLDNWHGIAMFSSNPHQELLLFHGFQWFPCQPIVQQRDGNNLRKIWWNNQCMCSPTPLQYKLNKANWAGVHLELSSQLD